MEKQDLRERTLVISEGRITIPKKYREQLGIKEGSLVELYPIGKNKLVIEVLTK